MLKKSRYSLFFKHPDGGWAYFNTLTGGIALLTDEEYSAFQNMEDMMADEEAAHFREFIEIGALIDADIDEFGLITACRMRRSFLDYSVYYRILTTTACNARCAYCYENGVKWTTMEPSTALETAKFICKQSRYDRLYLHFFGGEPLLNHEVISIILKQIKSSGTSVDDLNIYITTNGSLVTEKIAELSRKEWGVTWYQITIDDTDELYDAIKRYGDGKKYFDKVIGGIGFLLNYGIETRIRINYMPGSYDNIKRVSDALVERFRPFLQSKLLKIDPMPIFDTPRTMETAVKRGPKSYLYEAYQHLNPMVSRDNLYNISFKGGLCFACQNKSCIVAPDGRLYKCTLTVNDPNTSVGSLEKGLSPTKEFYSWIDPQLPDECNNCIYLPICQGGCRAGYFGYIDHSCDIRISEIEEIIKYRIAMGALPADDAAYEDNTIYLN